MYYFLTFVVGVVAGAIAAVIFYRRNIAKVEEALKKAETLRDEARDEARSLRDRLGG